MLQRHENLADRLVFEPNFPRRAYTVPDLKNDICRLWRRPEISHCPIPRNSTSTYIAPIRDSSRIDVKDLRLIFFLSFTKQICAFR